MTPDDRTVTYLTVKIDHPDDDDSPILIPVVGDQVRLVPLQGNPSLDCLYGRVLTAVSVSPVHETVEVGILPAHACPHGKPRQAWCGECQADWLGVG